MLGYCSVQTTLELTQGGTLLPWLGPALRGLVARRLKERICRWPPEVRATRWVHCAGCPYLQECPYGELFEPETPSSAVRLGSQGTPVRFAGQEDAVRPLILAPYYPLPERVPMGLRVPLRITLLHSGRRHLEWLLAALRDVGQTKRFAPGAPAADNPSLLPANAPFASGSSNPALFSEPHAEGTETWRDPHSVRGGIGPDHIGFRLHEGARAGGELSPADLPPTPHALPGFVPRLGVGLLSPLFLYTRDGRGRRRVLAVPQFADLFLAATRVLSGLFALAGQPLAADFKALKEAARQVPLVEHCYQPFRQAKWSSRSEQRFLLQGAVGGGVYGNVPWALVPWMLWGGRFHVGPHRVAGAGGWRLVLD